MRMVLRSGLVFAFLTLFAVGSAQADYRPAPQRPRDWVGPGETKIIDLTGNIYDEDFNGITVHNKSRSSEYGVYMESWPANPGRVIDGYACLDRSLSICLVWGESHRTLVRVQYRIAELREKGIIPGTELLMRRSNGVWKPAYMCVRDARARKIPYGLCCPPTREMIHNGRERGRIGNYGYWYVEGSKMADGYVWGVVDVDGEYAVGGLIPEPATVACLFGGLAGLGWIRRRSVRRV